MIDLSKYPCPLCGNKLRNQAELELAYCGNCALGIEGPDGSEQSAADAWIELSEKVHGKPHDGKTVKVRGMVVLLDNGRWVIAGAFDPEGPNPSDDEMYKELERGLLPMRIIGKHIITANIPIPVAQEVKGRVSS